MARTILKNKTALVLGADSPAGRAVALQLSREGTRVILAGYDARRIALVVDLIRAKRGDPHECILVEDQEVSLKRLIDVRELTGNHYHFIVNCLASVEGDSDVPDSFPDRAREVPKILPKLIGNRGAVRLMTIWPEDAGTPPEVDGENWHSLVIIPHLEMGRDGASASSSPVMVKAGGVADAVVFLLSCPPSACPVMVRLEPRHLKS